MNLERLLYNLLCFIHFLNNNLDRIHYNRHNSILFFALAYMNYEQVRFHIQRVHASKQEEKESLICLSLNNQEIRHAIEMADFLIKVFHFGRTLRGFENNFIWFLIHFGIHFYMSTLYRLILRIIFVKSKKVIL